MKATKITYWISTGLVSLMMTFSAYAYFTSPQVITGFTHLGYPDYFRVELGIAKILGALTLILPFAPSRLKEWAYAGFFITFLSAFIAHVVSGDPASNWGSTIVFMIVLAVSYVSYHKLQSARTKAVAA